MYCTYTKGRIAGYPIQDIIMSYAYDGAYRLISIKVDLINADYDVLKEKLTKCYNTGEQTITEEGIASVVWKGDNSSGVLLYTENDGLDYTLIYGRLDAAEILSNCLKTDPDDISGL